MPKGSAADFNPCFRNTFSSTSHQIYSTINTCDVPNSSSTCCSLPRCADATPSNSRARRRQVDMDDSLRLRRAMSASVLSGISLLASEAMPSCAMAVEMRLFRRVVPA